MDALQLHYLKQSVTDEINEGIRLANAHYHINVPYPEVIWAKRGATAGTANYDQWRINLNEAFLVKEGQTFVKRTPKHELAHLICHMVYPEAYETKLVHTRRGIRRTKRDVHGARWQEIMIVIGIPDPTRCHSYDTSHLEKRGPKAGSKQFTCGCHTYTIGAKRGARILAELAAGHKSPMWCRKCKGRLIPVGQAKVATTPEVPYNDEAAGIRRMQSIINKLRAAPPQVPLVIPGPNSRFKSKLDVCRHIMNFSRGKTRDQLIAEMVNEAGCTLAGAATYYAKIKNELGL